MRAPVWLSTNDAADYLGVGYPTIRRLIDNGDLVAYRVGRLIRVRQEDLVKFVEKNRVRPGSLKSGQR